MEKAKSEMLGHSTFNARLSTLNIPLSTCPALRSQDDAFAGEETVFPVQAAAKAAEPAVGGENAVAGDEDGDGVGPAGAADGADGPGPANGGCDLAVAFGQAGGDFQQFAPDGLLEGGGAGPVERRQFLRGVAGQDFFQGGLGEPVPGAEGGRNHRRNAPHPARGHLLPRAEKGASGTGGTACPTGREVQFHQAFIRVMREEYAVGGGDGQDGRRGGGGFFHGIYLPRIHTEEHQNLKPAVEPRKAQGKHSTLNREPPKLFSTTDGHRWTRMGKRRGKILLAWMSGDERFHRFLNR